MRRKGIEVKYWNDRTQKLFNEYPETKLVKNRYSTLKILLQQRHPELCAMPGIENFLKDAVYIDRKVRLFTEGSEQELKQELVDNFIENELNGQE